MQNIKELQRRLKNDLPTEGISYVIKSLKSSLPESSPKYNILLELDRAYREIKLKIMEGTLSTEKIQLSNANISSRLLQLIDSLEAVDFDSTARHSNLAPDQKIKKGHVLYKIPNQMQLGEEARCLVRIAFEKAMLIEDLDIDENTQFRMNVRISDYMRVELGDSTMPPAFQIRSSSEPIQFIDKDDFTEWRFYVKPLLAGEHILELKVTIMLVIDGKERVRERVLEESVVIVAEAVPESTAEFKKIPEDLVLPCTTATVKPIGVESFSPAPTGTSFRLPKAVRTFALGLVALMVFSTVSYAIAPQEVSWVVTRYIENDAEAYEEYIEKYPASRHRETATFRKAVIKDDPAAYQEYIQEYPQGNIEYLETASFKVATLNQEPALLASFVQQFPRSEYVPQATNTLEKLETKVWQEVQQTRDTTALKNYLEIYPQGKFKEAAKDSLTKRKISTITTPTLSLDEQQNETSELAVTEPTEKIVSITPTKQEEVTADNNTNKPESSRNIEKTPTEETSTTDKEEEATKETQTEDTINKEPTDVPAEESAKETQTEETIKEEPTDIPAEDGLVTSYTKMPAFTDSRDNKQYPVIKIGNQVWMAKNMEYKTADSWIYDDDPKNCNQYGRLYTWAAAKKACPTGWHLPSDEEWQQLLLGQGGYYDVDTSEDLKNPKQSYTALIDGGKSNFSARLGGRRNSYGEFDFLTSHGYFWSSTESDADIAWSYDFLSDYGEVFRSSNFKSSGLSCRCLKD